MGRRRGLPARWVGALLMALMALAGLSGPDARPAPAGAVWGAWIATERASLRTAPEEWADVAGQAWQGEWVEVQDGPSESGWYEVAAPDADGWVEGDHLAFEQDGWTDDADSGSWIPAERWIDVDRGDGTLTLFDGDAPVRTWWGVMSADSSDDGFYATALGTYHVYDMNADLAWTEWGQAWISHWVGFDPDRMNGFHSFSLDEHGVPVDGGDTATGGCVALPSDSAADLYWSVEPGMRVEVHW